jgi:pimeloyl-ACP methyl ester carboxylesterase
MATRLISQSPVRDRLLAGLPVEERLIEPAGITTAVLEGGEGPPLVFLHGPGEFAGKWLRIIPDLVETNRFVAPDLPGHGASAIPDPSLTEERLLEWVDQLIEQTCSEAPTLVGHVLGGAIAARFAAERSDRIRRLVLVDSLGLARFRPSPAFAAGLIGFQTRPSEASYNRFMKQCSYDLNRLRDDMGERWDPFVTYNLETAKGPRSKEVGRMLRRFGLPRLPASELSGISVPTSLIWGRQDKANRLRVAEAASGRFGWPLFVVEDCADDPARDRPRAFIGALREAIRAG